MEALPRGVVGAVVKVQATFRGYIFRARYFSRARSVAAYCKAARWPLAEPPLFSQEADDDKGKSKKRKKAKKADPKKLDAEIAAAHETTEVSKYLGGEGKKK